MNDVYKNAIELLPSFFDSQLQLDASGAGIFAPLGKIIEFDEAFIFFLNPESISLRYQFSKNSKYFIGDIFPIDEKMSADLFSASSVVVQNDDSLIYLLGLVENNSFLITKLIIKNTVFGFVLLCKNEADFYNADNINIMKAVSSVIAYSVKDVELSEVLNTQIKALAKNVLQVKESEKIKTEFLANISHELRTPLNSIIGYSEILNNGFYGALNEKQTEFVNDINVSGVHLLGMINEILDISKIESNAMQLNKTEFEVTLAIDEVVNVVKSLADKKKLKINKFVDQNAKISADFQKVKQILYNLLDNAIKFSPENDEISLKAYIIDNNLRIEVRDNGVGIAPENHLKIFDKFLQLENAYIKKESSTGLGLTITKELVQMHNGKIRVESEIGKGAMFIVELPVNVS